MITLTRLVATAALVAIIACAGSSKTQPPPGRCCARGFWDGKGRSKNHADSLPRNRDQGG